MKLLTEAMKAKFPALGSQDGNAGQAPVIAKFFDPRSNWTWYAIEGATEGDDFMMFGLVIGFETELGYFSLRELESVNRIERDRHFGDHTLGEFMGK